MAGVQGGEVQGVDGLLVGGVIGVLGLVEVLFSVLTQFDRPGGGKGGLKKTTNLDMSTCVCVV